jgi:SAM-dependent methyltransferase
MLELATRYLSATSSVLDVGCRDGSHLIRLIEETGAVGVGIDPVPRHVHDARTAVTAAGLGARVSIFEATMQALPFPDAAFDLVWCRDVIEVVVSLEEALSETARVLRPGGRLLVYTVLATDLLQPAERALLNQSLAMVSGNLARPRVEDAFRRAGLVVAAVDAIGTEWREWLEERTHPAAIDLLRLARLRRQREQILRDVGPEIYGHIEANLHWGAFQLLGKLEPTLYVLEKPL